MAKKIWKPITKKQVGTSRGFWRYTVQIGKFVGSKDDLIAITKEKNTHQGWFPIRNFYVNLNFAKEIFMKGGLLDKVKEEYDGPT